jgi:hypothetical protein
VNDLTPGGKGGGGRRGVGRRCEKEVKRKEKGYAFGTNLTAFLKNSHFKGLKEELDISLKVPSPR